MPKVDPHLFQTAELTAIRVSGSLTLIGAARYWGQGQTRTRRCDARTKSGPIGSYRT
jgi:hypothetical protein